MDSVTVNWQIINLDECAFQITQSISSETVTYDSSLSAVRSPLASKIFGFPWTKSVSVGPTEVRVNKHDWVEWSVLAEPLSNLIREHVEQKSSGQQSVEENPQVIENEISHPLAESISALIENEINPSVAGHGGYIRLVDIKDNQVFISMEGGCQGCASSKMTLQEGISETVKKYFPQITSVVDVTNHALGQNPYY